MLPASRCNAPLTLFQDDLFEWVGYVGGKGQQVDVPPREALLAAAEWSGSVGRDKPHTTF